MIKPTTNRIVVKPIKAETTTKSGLVITNAPKHKMTEGVAVAVGPGRVGKDGELIDMQIPVGVTLIYIPNAGQRIEIDDEVHYIITENDVLAIK
jgi:chaperonin GroES